jgi:acetylornithine deacetylase
VTDWRARVLEAVDAGAPAMEGLLAELVRVPSVSGSAAENDLQARLAATLRDQGLEVDHWPIPLAETMAAPGFPGAEVPRAEAWGLVGRLAGRSQGPSLMLNAHVDVVPAGDRDAWAGDPFGGEVRGGSLYGRGACDMKGGLVAALAAVRALCRARVPLGGDLLVACVQGEEDGGLGTFAMLGRGWRADACVIPEPTGLHLVPATAGALTFRLRVPGRAAHAARRTEGVSAVEKFWPLFQALRALERARNAEVDPLLSRWAVAYPIEVGMVRGGDWASSVPDLLVAEGRLGVALDEPVDRARAALEAAVADACRADPWLREHPAGVEWWGGQFAPGRTPPDSPLLAAVGRAHAATSDRPQERWAAPYGSDLRLMTGLGGVPTVHYGPGDARLAHGPNESVPLAEVRTTARALAVLALDHCGVAG